MIHQLIFAHAKPGMGEKEFLDYWINIHAVQYASKIPQIKRYLIDSRIPFGPEPADPLFHGVAEIWLENEEAQLASLQSKEFLEGARIDEPKWAAFWRTVVLDTTTHILMEGPPMLSDSSMVKLFLMVKRKPGMSLEEFHRYSLDEHGPKVTRASGLQRYHQCHVRDSAYTIGETLLDSVSILWFQDLGALERAIASPEYRDQVLPDLSNFVDPKYVHTMVASEQWIIGPDVR